jgi:protein-disulfide isomerase
MTRWAILTLSCIIPFTLAAQEPKTSSIGFRAVTNEADQGITKEQSAKIIQELQMIRMLLERQADLTPKAGATPLPTVGGAGDASPLKTISMLGDHILGDSKAPVTLVEFLDLQCSFCMQFHKDVLPQLQSKYIQTGKVRLAIVDFPLESHAYAIQAAKLARCAGEQGKYWQVHDVFLSAPQVATDEVIRKIAGENQLDQNQLEQCLTSPRTLDQIMREADAARELGVFGTPTFLLGRSRADGATGRIIQGAPSLDAFEARIDELLKQDGR